MSATLAALEQITMVRLLTRPTPAFVAMAVREYLDEPRFSLADRAVELVFRQWPLNTNETHVLAKVAILDRLYSTNVFHFQSAAAQIVQLGIDDLLNEGDQKAVAAVAGIPIQGQSQNRLSFATKFCAWHRPDRYQIYDTLVDKMLCSYQQQEPFCKFGKSDLRSYPLFIQIVDSFRSHFGLEQFTRKELDQFFWIEGRKQPKKPK